MHFIGGALPAGTEAQAVAYFESGGTQEPVQKPAARRAPNRPLRFLCLHGGGGNHKVSTAQVRKLAQLFGTDATFEYLEGPRIYPDDEVDKVIKSMFGPGPYFGWYGVDHNDKTSRPYVEKLSDPSVHFEYKEAEKAIDRVASHIAHHGPYDVLLGFSQGAIIITILTAQRLKAAREQGAAPPEWLLNVLVCGMPPRDDRYIELTTKPPIDFPCSLMFGKKDGFYAYGQRLRDIYVNPDIFEHERGHEFPAATDPLNQQWVESMRKRLGLVEKD